MKKTVIIAIFLVCLASIIALQFFGAPATVPQSGVYIEKITVTGVTKDGEDIGYLENSKLYWFYFIPCENGEYTTSEESLASNPNRVKIEYVLAPDNADKSYLQYVLDNENVVLLKETDEVIFLKPVKLDVVLKESKANLDAQTSVSIMARRQS